MSYKLIYRGGKYNRSKGEWERKWDFVLDVDALHTTGLTSIRIETVSTHSNYDVALHLNNIPARIDVETGPATNIAWLLDEEDISLFPDPYRSLPNHQSKTVWEASKDGSLHRA